MNQKELKELLQKEYEKHEHDASYVKWLIKEAGYVVKIKNFFYVIDKPSIQKDFCYGYGYNGITDFEDMGRAESLADRAENDVSYFINVNMQPLNDSEKYFREASKLVYFKTYIYDDVNIIAIKDYRDYINHYNNLEVEGELTEEEKEAILEGFQQVKKDFSKRLNTYLKRYGLTKVRSWTYLVD